MALCHFIDLVENVPGVGPVIKRFTTRNVPLVRQMSGNECGAACLAMVLEYYGKIVPLGELRASVVSARDATNAQQLIDIGREYGLTGSAVAVTGEHVHDLAPGTILHWKFRHFVVLNRISPSHVEIVDPALGRRKMSFEIFSRGYSGIAICLTPAPEFVGGGSRGKSGSKYLKAVLDQKYSLCLILAASLMSQALSLGVPFITRTVIDNVIPSRNYHLLPLLAAGACALSVTQFCIGAFRAYLVVYLRSRVDLRMTVGLVDHLLRLPLEFSSRRSTGDLLGRIGSSAAVRETLTSVVMSLVIDGAMAIGQLSLLIWWSRDMAAVTVCLACVQVGVLLFTRHRQRRFLTEGLDAQAKSQSILVETLNGLETLKSMGLEARAVSEWSKLYAGELRVALRRGRFDALLDALANAVRTGSSLTLLVVGTLQTLRGVISVGEMMATIAVATGFLTPLLSLIGSGARLQLMSVHIRRLDDVLESRSEYSPAAGRNPCRMTSIEMRKVSFRYGPVSALVVRDVSLFVREGEFVALVGRSGSGKSTLARLLVGLYWPTAGSILIGGLDLRSVDLASLRSQLGVVTQHPQLFAGTVRSNLTLAAPNAGDEAIVRAAKLACIHEDIMQMPRGYDTPLMERGASLSGGQQQRLALGRALIGAPRLLLLDEATSQLDAVTENAIQRCLATLTGTKIIIAHRLSTVRHADRIIVLEAGEIVEEGTHDALLRRNATYADLVAAQTSA